MGKKGKPDEPEQYEIWLSTETQGWKMVVEDNNGGIFTNRARSLALAEKKSEGAGIVEVLVIARRPIATFNGEAIGSKHRLNAVVKKEVKSAEVQRSGPEADDVQHAGAADEPEAGPGGPSGEGTVKG